MLNIKTKAELADYLEIPLKSLTYILYIAKADSFYTTFEIPKKNGKTRIINAPNGLLKHIQKTLSLKLYDYDMLQKRRNQTKTNISHGFERGKNIITNAKIHRNKRYVFTVDLENFFESFHFGRVKGYFEHNNDFLLPTEIATCIAQLTCYNGHLPQGAPTSPIIANFICKIMDIRILKLAKNTS